jgi:hypothetical protein
MSKAKFEEPKVIWLEPWCDECATNDCSDYGRQWCEVNVWEPCEECGAESVKYVLASPTPTMTEGA